MTALGDVNCLCGIPLRVETFHPRATLSIAAYGFPMARRLKTGSDSGDKTNFTSREALAIPNRYIPRRSPARAAPRGKLDHNVAVLPGRRPRNCPGTPPTLQLEQSASTPITQ